MLDNYTMRFGLEYNPFLKGNKGYFIPTSDSKEMNFKLNYLLKIKGIGVFTGESGKGKTTTIRNFVEQLNKTLYKVFYISLSTVTVQQFYRLLASELGLESKHQKYQNFKLIQEGIITYSDIKKITPVIIIDEANYLSSSVLNDFKMLFNFQMDSSDKAVVILCGLPKLNSILSLAIHEPFRQRIVINYHLDGLTKEETRLYVETKLQKAGGSPSILDEGSFEALSNASNGTPREIDKMMNFALLIADQNKSNIITREIMEQAIGECSLV